MSDASLTAEQEAAIFGARGPIFTTVILATGSDGNIFAVLATARRLMGEIGVDGEMIAAMTERVMRAGSYDHALAVIREWFPIDTGGAEARS
jgi:hypothetical protein